MNEFLESIFGRHYPTEIVMLILLVMMGLPRRIQVSCGAYHTVLIKDNIYVWGANEQGQLGLGDCKIRSIPKEITPHKNIESIVCGWDGTIALVSDSNELYIWGHDHVNVFGPIYAHVDAIRSPTKFILYVDSNIKSINYGRAHVIVLLQSGKCYSWGGNDAGQLGLGYYKRVDSPQQIISLGSDIIKIGCGSGSSHCIAVTKFGISYVWGKNYYGQLGLDHIANEPSPKKLYLQNILSVGCGQGHTIVTTSDDKIYVWGKNDYGQLGLGDYVSRCSPRKLLLPNPKVEQVLIESVSCGFNHTMALTSDGKIYIWGRNTSGQLGLGHTSNINFPQLLHFPFKEPIKSIYGGDSHTLCTTDDKIYVWGGNRHGQLGLGDTKSRHKPCELKFFS